MARITLTKQFIHTRTEQSNDGYFPTLTPLPDSADWVDVTDHGVVGDGTTDNTAALNTLAGNTSITNWYFPAGSYLFKNVSIPGHVKFVFGDGESQTTILAKANTNTSNGSAAGALYIAEEEIDGLVIDGIHFEPEDAAQNPEGTPPEDCDPDLWPYEDFGYAGPSGNSWRWNGLISITGSQRLNNINIRNCSFDVTIFRFNCIKAFGGNSDGTSTRLNSNLWINNNYFEGFWQFAIEIIAVDRPEDGSARTLQGFRIFNNDFNCPAGGFPLSVIAIMANTPGTPVPTDGTENRVFNNKVYGTPVWFIEQSGNNSLFVYNNEAKGVTKKVISGGQGGLIAAIGYNEFYNNHCECTHEYGYESAIEWRNKDKMYGNYIDSPIIINEFADTENIHEFNEIFNNTLVYSNDGTDGPSALIVVQNSTSGLIHANEMYVGSRANKGIDYGSSASTAGNECYNNVINMKQSDGICVKKVDDDINDHDNTCNLGWTGEYPTGRDGAGLHDDTVIGPGNYPASKGD